MSYSSSTVFSDPGLQSSCCTLILHPTLAEQLPPNLSQSSPKRRPRQQEVDHMEVMLELMNVGIRRG